ncbi:MAG: response regulator transcription factor [Chloroflexota bacterium]|nr:response regulator transcription factor [Chloroflexota bacterium]
MTATVLVVEDDAQIRKVVESYLRQAGYRVLSAADGPTGLTLAQQEKPPLLVLDLMLPGIDGWEITRRLRSSPDPALAGMYIIMLTARVEETERIVGLELGADDYVTKPFSPRELVARVRSAVRRLETQAEQGPVQVLAVGALRLDPTYRTVMLDGETVDLTSTEFDLLHYLMRHLGRPFTRAALLEVTQADIFGDASAYERTIDAHVKNLRQKLGGAGRHSPFIETVHGIGYRFAPQTPEGAT